MLYVIIPLLSTLYSCSKAETVNAQLNPSTTRSVTATISSGLQGSTVPNFDVVFSIIGSSCFNPTISIAYEALDFTDNQADESFNVKDNDGSFITNCQGGGQCMAWQTCLDSADVLSTDFIAAGSSYTIGIETGTGFHKFCSGSSYSFYATVTLECETEWFAKMEPALTGLTSATVTISSELQGSTVPNFDVIFSIENNDCVNPTLSIDYEALDFTDNQADESFDVKDNDGSFITNCEGGGQCMAWQSCLDSSDVLSVDTISADSSYKIGIVTGTGFHKFCSGSLYSFYARVTLNCGVASSGGSGFESGLLGITYSLTAQQSACCNGYANGGFSLWILRASGDVYYSGIEFSSSGNFYRATATNNGVIQPYTYPTTYADGSSISLSLNTDIKLTANVASLSASSYNFYINEKLVGSFPFSTSYSGDINGFGIFTGAGNTIASDATVSGIDGNLLCDSTGISWTTTQGTFIPNGASCTLSESDAGGIFGRRKFTYLPSYVPSNGITFSATGQKTNCCNGYANGGFDLVIVRGSEYYYPGIDFSSSGSFYRASVTSNGVTTYQYPTTYADGTAISLSLNSDIKLTVNMASSTATSFDFYINDKLVDNFPFKTASTASLSKFGIQGGFGAFVASEATVTGVNDNLFCSSSGTTWSITNNNGQTSSAGYYVQDGTACTMTVNAANFYDKALFSYTGAKSLFSNFGIDWIYPEDDTVTTVAINSNILWIIVVLLVVNIICLTVYCWNNKCKSNKRRGYKVVKYDSESVSDV